MENNGTYMVYECPKCGKEYDNYDEAAECCGKQDEEEKE